MRKYKISNDVDFIFMGCDGIFECKSNQYIVDWLNEKQGKMPLREAIEEFMNKNIAENVFCNKNYLLIIVAGVGCDNMTAILIKFSHKKEDC